MTSLPTMSIVVPNLNGGATLARTLQSLVDQQYPQLQIVVMDGGSNDNSMEVIKQFRSHIDIWRSGPDRGQAHAINKGFAHCAGEVVNWLCSDDYLTTGALHRVGEQFRQSPRVDLIAGAAELHWLNRDRPYIQRPTLRKISLMPCGNPIAQPACFYRRELLDRDPPLDESFHFGMDFELWNYFLSHRGARCLCLDDVLAIYPLSGTNKTAIGGDRIIKEVERIYLRYTDERIPLTFWHRRLRLPLERLSKRHGNRLYPLLRPLQIGTVLLLAPFYGLERVRAMNWSVFV